MPKIKMALLENKTYFIAENRDMKMVVVRLMVILSNSQQAFTIVGKSFKLVWATFLLLFNILFTHSTSKGLSSCPNRLILYDAIHKWLHSQKRTVRIG